MLKFSLLRYIINEPHTRIGFVNGSDQTRLRKERIWLIKSYLNIVGIANNSNQPLNFLKIKVVIKTGFIIAVNNAAKPIIKIIFKPKNTSNTKDDMENKTIFVLVNGIKHKELFGRLFTPEKSIAHLLAIVLVAPKKQEIIITQTDTIVRIILMSFLFVASVI
jgi:hypothetical protein